MIKVSLYASIMDTFHVKKIDLLSWFVKQYSDPNITLNILPY